MKNLVELLEKYYRDNSRLLPTCYTWKINHDKLPSGVKLNPQENPYVQNIDLKQILSNKFKQSDSRNREKLIHYYIVSWGQIHRNSPLTIQSMARSDARTLISRGKKGVASWSKALVVHDCDRYAIFDARVSAALNALMLLNFTSKEKLVLFPVLPSRNNKIRLFNSEIVNSEIKFGFMPSDQFYSNYLELLNNVSQRCKTSIASVEMLLFSQAEHLIDQVVAQK